MTTDYLSFEVDLNAPETVLVYDELPLWSAPFGLLLLERVPIRPGMRVLDVAAGTGNASIPAAARGASAPPMTSPEVSLTGTAR